MKGIAKIIETSPKHWVGDGFHVHPVFERYAFTSHISPFLMFDYASPKDFKANKKRLGVGKHPHRGFETVTLAFEGEVEHADSTGGKGIIEKGDVQWMTAGKGIVHSEFHSDKFSATGGLFEMCQLWVNLPKSKKMTKPTYQAIKSSKIPKIFYNNNNNICNEEDIADGFVRIIAGSYNNVKGPATTHTPMAFYDVELTKKDKVFTADITEGWTTIVFNRGTSPITIGDNNDKKNIIMPQSVAIMETSNSTLTLKSSSNLAKALILCGEPINEPIAAQGPFVMNTQAEIQQAIKDYQMGKMG